MAGGKFTQQDKRLPGFYVNLASTRLNSIQTGLTGVVTMPLPLEFGANHQVVEVTADTNLSRTFGYDVSTSKNMFYIQEALREASRVLVYNLATGDKATAQIQTGVTAQANYGGTRGNDLRIIVRNSIVDDTKFDIITYLDTMFIDTQTITTWDEITNNEMVTFTVTGSATTPTANAGVSFTGGTTEEVTSSDYMEYFTEIDRWQFNTMALLTDDNAIKVAGANYVRASRDNRGKFVTLYVAGDSALRQSIDFEGVTVVYNGVKLQDDTVLTKQETVAWVAGASASAGVGVSLTYTQYPGAVDAVPRLSEEEQIFCIDNGLFAFIEQRGQVKVLQDINSLRTFTIEKNQDFSKNTIIRLIDDYCNNSKQVFEDNFVGQVPNNADGRGLFQSNRIDYCNGYQEVGAIEDFSADDITVSEGNEKSSVVMETELDPTDAMEKLYLYLRLR